MEDVFAIWANDLRYRDLHGATVFDGFELMLPYAEVIAKLRNGASNHRSFQGKLSFLSPAFRKATAVTLGEIHIYNKGTFWTIQPPIDIPLPFLMTNKVELNCRFSGPVVADFSTETRAYFRKRGLTSFPVASEDWIGVMQVNRSGLFFRKETVHLTVFSEKTAVNVENVLVFSCDDRDIPVGTVFGEAHD